MILMLTYIREAYIGEGFTFGALWFTSTIMVLKSLCHCAIQDSLLHEEQISMWSLRYTGTWKIEKIGD